MECASIVAHHPHPFTDVSVGKAANQGLLRLIALDSGRQRCVLRLCPLLSRLGQTRPSGWRRQRRLCGLFGNARKHEFAALHNDVGLQRQFDTAAHLPRSRLLCGETIVREKGSTPGKPALTEQSSTEVAPLVDDVEDYCRRVLMISGPTRGSSRFSSMKLRWWGGA